jgi:two-component system, NarL family, sensor kinase
MVLLPGCGRRLALALWHSARVLSDRPLAVTGAVVRFLLVSVAAIAVVLAGAAYVLRETALEEAQRNSRTFAALAGQAIIEPQITPGVLAGDAAALAVLDQVVQARVLAGLTDRIARIKIWDASGRIVYSDEPRLIGRRFALGADELESLRAGGVEVDVSDLAKPENVYERSEESLFEVYLPVRGPRGEQLLFELYERSSTVNAAGARALGSLAPWLAAAGVVLFGMQAPLAWRLARRVRRGQDERERLLVRAVDSSAVERRRIASDLHDGVVQDLSGIAFGLEAVAGQVGSASAAARVSEAAEGVRRGIRRLRTLLVEIHPPNLHAVGLESALSDVLSQLHTRGVVIGMDVDAPDLAPETEALVFRVAQEALRNVAKHAAATRVELHLHRSESMLTFTVADDGRGFEPELRDERGDTGHMGLSLLEGLVQDAGGRLSVRSAPGEGTRLLLEVPTR